MLFRVKANHRTRCSKARFFSRRAADSHRLLRKKSTNKTSSNVEMRLSRRVFYRFRTDPPLPILQVKSVLLVREIRNLFVLRNQQSCQSEITSDTQTSLLRYLCRTYFPFLPSQSFTDLSNEALAINLVSGENCTSFISC